MKITTAATLKLIKTIAALDFRPMDSNDFAAFAGADEDAQIAFGGEALALALCDAFGDALLIEEGNTIAVVASGERLEVAAMSPDYDPVSYSLNLTRL